jgi:hypothetical protein
MIMYLNLEIFTKEKIYTCWYDEDVARRQQLVSVPV